MDIKSKNRRLLHTVCDINTMQNMKCLADFDYIVMPIHDTCHWILGVGVINLTSNKGTFFLHVTF